MFRPLPALTVLAALLGSTAIAQPFVDPRSEINAAFGMDKGLATGPRDPACYDRKLVSTGEPAPRSPATLVVRWAGVSNFELVYKGKIILLDAYFNRGSNWPSLGFTAADVRTADVILIGHGHFDHMSDAASIGIRTGAIIVGAQLTTEKLETQSIPENQIRTVTGTGDEKLKFEGFTVEPIRALHGQPDKHITTVMETAVNSLVRQPTPSQQTEEKAIEDRGTSDPRVITEGTIAYLITFDDGFRVLYRDSGGHITEYEKAAMAKLPGVDLALLAVSADFLNPLTEQQALEYMRLYKADVYMPAHHDAGFSGHSPLWRATEPIFQALKDANPRLVTVSREYRAPVCFDTRINIAHSQGR